MPKGNWLSSASTSEETLLRCKIMENGWIKLHRKIKEKGYYNKPNYVFLWIHLLLSANHEPKEFMWNGNIIMLKEGQIITGRKKLALETGIAESTIEDILKMLEREHQIQQQKTTKYRLITIVNWGEYQKSNSTSDSEATTSRQQADTNKNNNNIKNVRKEITEHSSADIVLLIKAFEGINPACKRMYGIPPQRQACQDLIASYGFDRVKMVIEQTLPKTNTIPYFPTITTPIQLRDRWATLESKIHQYQSEAKTKKDKYPIAFTS